ncbi:hypothetical protein PV379_00340 [Streptomyces caniscabiei]|uniref:hypothetical protein n=1 Tax=Streptomyces caniscabiei TaxID=2746961 RepID=UPI0029A73A98|nr:hypothetical protein [Streptomyces caniscabiei]MDX2775805.1 hypothetical protein [Streptomyces caniscabiei]
MSAAITWLDQQDRGPLTKDAFHRETPRTPDITEEDWEAGKRLVGELSRHLI